jgi:diacylglycerol kinase family enzyme
VHTLMLQGKEAAIDIVSILQPPHPRRYAFLSITLGLIANLDIGTEHLRYVCFGHGSCVRLASPLQNVPMCQVIEG